MQQSPLQLFHQNTINSENLNQSNHALSSAKINNRNGTNTENMGLARPNYQVRQQLNGLNQHGGQNQ